MYSKKFSIITNIVLTLFAVAVVLPVIAMFLVSFSTSEDVKLMGYQFIPAHFSVDAYKLLFTSIEPLLRSILITIITGVVNAALGVAMCAIMGYVLTAPAFPYKKTFTTIFVIIPMIFHAGLIPQYIVNTQLLGLSDSWLVYIVLGLVAPSNIILFQVFFKSVPTELIEAAQIDGAKSFQIFLKVTMPMSKAVVSSVFCMSLLNNWNDYTKPLYYITNVDYFNIQYFLQNIMREADFINQLYINNPNFADKLLPTETLPFAAAVIAVLPVLLVFPYMQKFFSKGLATGSVKG